MIKREIVDGRPATVTYIGPGFAPANVNTATAVKVWFDDGEVVFLVPAPPAAKQAKAKARRAPRTKFNDAHDPKSGEFTSGDGGSGGGGSSAATSQARLPGEADKAFAKRVIDKRPMPESLPQNHETYFNMPEGTQIVPLANLVSSKSEAETVASGPNAAKRMEACANGELSKRDPISVAPISGTNKFQVLDGNSTFAAARHYGWTTLPVLEEGKATKRADVEEQKYSPDQSRGPDGKWDGGGGGGASSRGEKGIHARNPAEAKTVKKDWIKQSNLKTISELAAVASDNKPAYDQTNQAIADKLGVTYKSAPNKNSTTQKGIDRINEKLKGRPSAALSDMTRSSFIVDTPAQADAVVAELGKAYPMTDEGFRMTDVGYFDRQTNVKLPNGQIGEVLIAPPALFEAKSGSGGGHLIYEATRSLPKKDPARIAGNIAQRRIYGAAFATLSPDWKALFPKAGK